MDNVTMDDSCEKCCCNVVHAEERAEGGREEAVEGRQSNFFFEILITKWGRWRRVFFFYKKNITNYWNKC